MAKRKTSKSNKHKREPKHPSHQIQKSINGEPCPVLSDSKKFDKMTPPTRRSLRIAEKVLTLKSERVEAKVIVPLTRPRKTKLTAAAAVMQKKSTKNIAIVSKRTTRSASKLLSKGPDVAVKLEDSEKPKKRQNQSIEPPVTRRSLRERKEIVPTLATNDQSFNTGMKKAKKPSTTIRKKSIINLDMSTLCENLISSNGTLRILRKDASAPESKLDPSTEMSNADTATEFKIPTCNRPLKTVTTTRRLSVAICDVTPLIRRRTLPFALDISHVHLAKSALHLSKTPETLPGRENECKEILELIKGKLLDHSGGCMYVCGVPGTGKTATITEVIRLLKLQSDDKNLPHFDLIQMNGIQFTEPQQAYVHIYNHLQGIKVRWVEAVNLLDELFNNPKAKRKPVTILVVDEFDMLKSPGHRVIYNLLNWAMNPRAQLFVVAIGNIIDIERMGGITSRLGATRFTFLPYTQSQLQRIVQARLTGVNIYENDAVELIARKVASISGDCRRVLDICRRAIEIGEKDCSGSKIVIKMSHVSQAFDEMICNPKVIAIKGCSKYEKLFLQAVVAEIDRTGADETVLFQVYNQFEIICSLNGVSVPDPGIALRISSRLGASRLLICEHSSNSIHQKIMLNVTEDEMRYALDQK